MATFQNTNISANLFQFGNLRIFMNSQMNDTHVGMVRGLNKSYSPDLSHPLNRTVIHPESGTYFQLVIDLNLCDLILPSNQDAFKAHMFQDTVNFMLKSLRQFLTPNTVNEAGFKMSFYVPNGTPAAQPSWWAPTGITQLSWNQAQIGPGPVTSLGSKLQENFIRYVLNIHVNNEFNLVKQVLTNPSTYQPTTYQPTVQSTSPSLNLGTSPNFSTTNNLAFGQPSAPQFNFGQTTPSNQTQTQPSTTNFNPIPPTGAFGQASAPQFSFGQTTPSNQPQPQTSTTNFNPIPPTGGFGQTSAPQFNFGQTAPSQTQTQPSTGANSGFGAWTGGFGNSSFAASGASSFSLKPNSNSSWGF